MYRLLLDKGYRRYGKELYRPDCKTCTECQIIRIPVNEFVMTKSQKRVWSRGNKVIKHKIVKPEYNAEKVIIYQKYLDFQHQDINDPRKKEKVNEQYYKEFLVNTFLGDKTYELQLHIENKIVGVGIIDKVNNILSAVYFMFHPDYNKYSLGTYAILLGIDLAKKWNLEYYYPGYFIKNCKAMNYKSKFGPSEIKKINEVNYKNFNVDEKNFENF